MSDQPAVGLWAVCSIGYIGRITGRAELPWGTAWVGRTLDDTRDWSSRTPLVLGKDEQDRLNKLVADADLLTWFDTQREDMVERDSYGDPELVGHSWEVRAQRYTVREALQAEREYQTQRERAKIAGGDKDDNGPF